MSALVLQVIRSFYANFSKWAIFSANTYEKYSVCKDSCIAQHEEKLCLLPNYRYHIVLKEDIDGMLQKLDAFCFTYSLGLSLYTNQMWIQWENSDQERINLWYYAKSTVF